jgi:hypothetical protein
MAAIRSKRQFKFDAAAQERYRQKLVDEKVFDKGIAHLKGECDMSASQVTIWLKCVDKLLPSLQSVDAKVTDIAPFAVLPAVIEDVQAWSATFDPSLPDPKAKH